MYKIHTCVKKCVKPSWITSFNSHTSFMGNYYYTHSGDTEIEANKNEIGAGERLWAGRKTPEVCVT